MPNLVYTACALFVLGVALCASARLTAATSVDGRARRSAWPFMMWLLGWAWIGGSILTFCVSVAGGLLSPLMILIAITAVVMTIVELVRTRREAFWSLLAACLERDMPLAGAIRAGASLFSGVRRRRAELLADAIEAGTPLGDALDQSPRLVPPEVALANAAGTTTGQRAAAVRLALQRRRALQPLEEAVLGHGLYALLVFSVGAAAAAVWFSHSFPAMLLILDEFQIEGPGTNTILQLAILPTFVAPALWTVAFVTLVAMFVFWLSYLGWSPARRLAGLFLPPGVRGRREAVELLLSLAPVVAAGQSLEGWMRTATRRHPRRRVRRRIERARVAMEQGSDWIEALLSARLISQTDAALLASAQRMRNLPWAVRTVAEAADRRLMYRLQLLLSWLGPLGVLAAGVVVAAIVLAVFVPLIELIRSLA